MDKLTQYRMNCQKYRQDSFKNWPFTEECNCTPMKMASAGFYHCPSSTEPDLVQCFACFKEMDGWEPNDDPWKEHEAHSSLCPFLKLNRGEEKLTVTDFLKLEAERQKLYLRRIVDLKVEELNEQAKSVKLKMEELK